jgi:hypothetical protein
MTSQEAKQIAERWVIVLCGPEFVICSPPLFEDDSYFVFSWNGKRFFETRDPIDCYYGRGPTVLDKRDGRFFQSNSSCKPLERFVEEHRMRAKRESVLRRRFPDYDMRKLYRVLIRKIHDPRRLLELLESFELRYVIPEIETNTIWRVAKQYNKKLLKKRLSEPVPIVFGYLGAAGTVAHLYQLLGPCEIGIEEYYKQRKTHDPLNAKREDLEPEW